MTERSSSRPRGNRWQRLSVVVMAAGLLSLVAAGVLLALTLSGNIGTKGYTGPGTTIDIGDIREALTPLPTPTIALPPGDDAPIAQLVIPKYDVAAPVQVKGVDGNNVMQSPDGPTNVAWYDFSAKPGFGGNAVFSGHVDYINYGPAVFWNIKNLVPGDMIEVHLNDGTIYKYKVSAINAVSADPTEEELRDIVGPSQTDIVTLITCGGTFSYETHQYDQRTIVRAQRVLEPATARTP